MQTRIPLIKLFTIGRLTLAHLGTFSSVLRQNVKLYEIRGSSRHLCSNDTQSLDISFPYAPQLSADDIGASALSFLFLCCRC